MVSARRRDTGITGIIIYVTVTSRTVAVAMATQVAARRVELWIRVRSRETRRDL